MLRKVWVILNVDRQCRAEIAGSGVEAFLVPYPPLVKEAFIWMRGWYHVVEYRTSPVKG